MYTKLINRILLGLVMLVPGLMKAYAYYQGPSSWFVPGMLAGIGFPAPIFFAWVLMISEIVFGIAILANWKLKYTVWPPILILVVAAFTVARSNPSSLLLHLIAAVDLYMISNSYCDGDECCMHVKHKTK